MSCCNNNSNRCGAPRNNGCGCGNNNGYGNNYNSAISTLASQLASCQSCNDELAAENRRLRALNASTNVFRPSCDSEDQVYSCCCRCGE
ncbi:MAG: hypothetical protein LIO46_00500 [Clostridiales bacterium]|nr:hypothetical protein [Clostridiales bacterium]